MEGKTLDQYLRTVAGGESIVAFEERVMDFYAEQIVEHGLLEPCGMHLKDLGAERPVRFAEDVFKLLESNEATRTPSSPLGIPTLTATTSDPFLAPMPLEAPTSAPPSPLLPASDKEATKRALTAGLTVDVSPSSSAPASASTAPWRQLHDLKTLSPDERRALAVLPSPKSMSAPQSPNLRSISGTRGLNQAPKFGSASSLNSNKGSASIRALIEDFEKMTTLEVASSEAESEVVTQRRPIDQRESVVVVVPESLPAPASVAEEPEQVSPSSADPSRRNILVITHGGVLQSLFTHFLNELDFEVWCEVQAGFPKHAALYQLQLQKVVYGEPERDDWEWRGIISMMNSVSHHSMIGKASWHQWNPHWGKRRQEYLEQKAIAAAASQALGALDYLQQFTVLPDFVMDTEAAAELPAVVSAPPSPLLEPKPNSPEPVQEASVEIVAPPAPELVVEVVSPPSPTPALPPSEPTPVVVVAVTPVSTEAVVVPGPAREPSPVIAAVVPLPVEVVAPSPVASASPPPAVVSSPNPVVTVTPAPVAIAVASSSAPRVLASAPVPAPVVPSATSAPSSAPATPSAPAPKPVQIPAAFAAASNKPVPVAEPAVAAPASVAATPTPAPVQKLPRNKWPPVTNPPTTTTAPVTSAVTPPTPTPAPAPIPTPEPVPVRNIPKVKVSKVEPVFVSIETNKKPEKTTQLMSPRSDSAGFKAALEKFGGTVKKPKDALDADLGLPPLKKSEGGGEETRQRRN